MEIEETTAPAETAASAPDSSSLICFRAAIALSFLSQFLAYSPSSSTGMLDHELDTNFYTGITIWNRFAENGWHAHAIFAFVGLPLLGWVYFLKGRFRPWWARHGHWAALGIMLICSAGDWHSWGCKLGIVATGLTIWAVVLRRRELASASPPASA